MNLPVKLALREGHAENPDGFAVKNLLQGDLVAVAFENQKNRREQHWVLATAVSGDVMGGKMRPDTISILDSSGTDPCYSTSNARLRLSPSSPGSLVIPQASKNPPTASKSATAKVVWLHEGTEWTPTPVLIRAAVRFRLQA